MRELLSVPFGTLDLKMYDENDLIHSPLQRSYTEDGKTIEICIYRMPDTGWTAEVVDLHNNSTVWDGEFESDQAALDEVLKDIREDGIEAFIGMGKHDLLH